MKVYTCRKCGGRIIFRTHVWHKTGSKIIFPHCSKAFPIHLDGDCGQLLLELSA